jgi:hypothetical protein
MFRELGFPREPTDSKDQHSHIHVLLFFQEGTRCAKYEDLLKAVGKLWVRGCYFQMSIQYGYVVVIIVTLYS